MTDEIGLVALFADLAELSRNRPAGEELKTELRVHSAREHLHTYLQSLEWSTERLPDAFGAADPGAGPFRGHQPGSGSRGSGGFVPDLLALSNAATCTSSPLLEQWLGDQPPARAGEARAELERLVRATQRRFPWWAIWPAASGSAGSTSRWSTRSVPMS